MFVNLQMVNSVASNLIGFAVSGILRLVNPALDNLVQIFGLLDPPVLEAILSGEVINVKNKLGDSLSDGQICFVPQCFMSVVSEIFPQILDLCPHASAGGFVSHFRLLFAAVQILAAAANDFQMAEDVPHSVPAVDVQNLGQILK